MVIDLPWPPSQLSPNGRSHWAKKARVAKRYRRDCAILARSQGVPPKIYGNPRITISFHQPDNRHRDADNMIGAFKAGQDGFADWLGIDDAKWSVNYRFPIERAGLVRIEIHETEKAA